MELTMPLPCRQRKPASMTVHLELSTMMGRRAMSGSEAIRFRKRTMAAWLSSMASSMLTSMTWAPFTTCWRATARASSNWPLRIMRANALEPVTLVRSPTLTKSASAPMVTGSRPDSLMGGREISDMRLTCAKNRQTGERRCGSGTRSKPDGTCRCNAPWTSAYFTGDCRPCSPWAPQRRIGRPGIGAKCVQLFDTFLRGVLTHAAPQPVWRPGPAPDLPPHENEHARRRSRPHRHSDSRGHGRYPHPGIAAPLFAAADLRRFADQAEVSAAGHRHPVLVWVDGGRHCVRAHRHPVQVPPGVRADHAARPGGTRGAVPPAKHRPRPAVHRPDR